MNPPHRPRHAPLLLTGIAVLILAVVAIGLVIETAVGGKTKDNFSPPTPIPLTAGISGSPTPSAHAAELGPMQLVQGRYLRSSGPKRSVDRVK